MASVVSTKTRKLDAICAKLKLICSDSSPLPGSAVTSTPCRTEPLTQANFLDREPSPINFSIATKHNEDEAEHNKRVFQQNGESEAISEKQDISASECDEDGENGVLCSEAGKSENVETNVENVAKLTGCSSDDVSSSVCNTESMSEKNNNNLTEEQLIDLSKTGANSFAPDNCETLKETCEIDSKENEGKTNHNSNKHSEEAVSPLQTPVVSSQEKISGASRRKRRKATPRSITHVREILEQYDNIDEKDELAQYEINNLNTTFPPPENEGDDEDNDEEENVGSVNESIDMGDNSSLVKCPSAKASITSDYSINDINNSLVTKSSDTKNSRKARKPQILTNSSMPLDLSVCRSEVDDYVNSDSSEFEYSMDGDEASIRSESGRNSPEDLSFSMKTGKQAVPKAKVNNSNKQDNQEISALKDYAENTMNELLQMYGLSRSADSVTGQLQLDNFSSNNILAHGGQSHGKDKFRPILPKKFKEELQMNGHDDRNVAQSNTASPSTSTLGGQAGIYINFVNSHTNKPHKQNDEGNRQQDKFTNSAAYIKAVFNHQNKGKAPNQQGRVLLPDYSKYLKRFNNGQECQVKYCRELGYREHFHCMDCNFRVFVKKEEMVRHFKWHRKREESLQHGFMRYSPMDDCSLKFGNCTHNGRQTHYHCLQGGCDKVYISTSDVQMHANYHRKDSAIIQEGFQRFRATEDCGTPSCAFYGQRTTHFHCRRQTCNFTFKNKADMEKHKTYHQKDEVLGKDGFKKFMKYEHCGYVACRYSKVSNHIHCIRPGCNYVLHSTAQLYSHKRKHERRDFESAYRKFREDQHDTGTIQAQGIAQGTLAPSMVTPLSSISLNHESMSLPVSIKREAADDFEVSDSKKFKADHPTMSLPLSIKQEVMDDSESNDSRHMLESSELYNENSMSDMKSESSESFTNMDASNQEMDSDSIRDDASDVPDEPNSSISALNLSGDKLGDSLTLPIPKVYTQENIKVTSPQEATPVQPQVQLSVKTPTSVSPSEQTSPPVATILLPARPPIMDKREKDESWKNYLIRYTANDPCNSRCQYLYKDHYHCKVEGCLVLFKSKDGVREHARFHELQDRITPVAYHVYEPLQVCPNSCQYSLKEKHYHCIWSGCTHVVPHIGPTFGRLEHYRIHEYARASQGKTYKSSGSKMEDNSPRRRGRPPKYPKINIPVIPKVELSEQEIAESTRKVAIGNTGLPKVINGFKMFEENEECPDELCIYRMKQHYHCARPRCHHATDRLDVLNLHAKDFHNFVNIMEGFEFFDRNVNCRRAHCNNNKLNRHFHCVKPKCDYSFVRHSTMMQHDKKHKTEGASKVQSLPRPLIKKEAPVSLAGFVPIIPALSPSPLESMSKGTIKTSGTYFPLSGLSKASSAAVSTITSQLASAGEVPILSPPINPLQSVAGSTLALVVPSGTTSVATPVITQGASGNSVPLSVLLQQKTGNTMPQPRWSELQEKMHYDLHQNCGRPFCKLKKKDHYHCFDCNQAFSDPSRLRVHVCKHGVKIDKAEDGPSKMATLPLATPTPVITQTVTQQAVAADSDDFPLRRDNFSDPDDDGEEDELNGSSSLNLEFSTFSSMIQKAQQAHAAKPLSSNDSDSGLGFSGKLVIDEKFQEDNLSNSADMEVGRNSDSQDDVGFDDANGGSFGRKSGRKRTATKHDDFVDSNSIVVKQKKGLNPRSGKDDSIPDGYLRIKQKEDCHYEKCAYRQGVTHFHCSRADCGYSFSDRSRLIQHTLRHERIDSLTGGEMRQFRMNQDCNLANCEYQGKASHFHCLKCDYCCTDSSKVLTHRKYHAKMDSISSQGFKKAPVDEECNVPMCQYNRKQTHYHCTRSPCNYAVLGPAQMSSHKIKHAS